MKKTHKKYWVGNDLGLWWSIKLKKWMPLSSAPDSLDLTNKLTYLSKGYAFGLVKKLGEGFYVTEFIWATGWCTETFDYVKGKFVSRGKNT